MCFCDSQVESPQSQTTMDLLATCVGGAIRHLFRLRFVARENVEDLLKKFEMSDPASLSYLSSLSCSMKAGDAQQKDLVQL